MVDLPVLHVHISGAQVLRVFHYLYDCREQFGVGKNSFKLLDLYFIPFTQSKTI